MNNYRITEEYYTNALTEVYEILKLLSKEDYEKIPEDVILAIIENRNKNYFWSYDDSKLPEEQDISRNAVKILSYINMEYLLNEEQKKIMKEIHVINEKKYQEEHKAKLNELFPKEKKNKIKDKTSTNEVLPAIVKENIIIHYIKELIKGIKNKFIERGK